MRLLVVLLAVVTLVLCACSAVPRPLNPVRSVCTDACFKVDDRDRAQCIAKCE